VIGDLGCGTGRSAPPWRRSWTAWSPSTNQRQCCRARKRRGVRQHSSATLSSSDADRRRGGSRGDADAGDASCPRNPSARLTTSRACSNGRTRVIVDLWFARRGGTPAEGHVGRILRRPGAPDAPGRRLRRDQVVVLPPDARSRSGPGSSSRPGTTRRAYEGHDTPEQREEDTKECYMATAVKKAHPFAGARTRTGRDPLGQGPLAGEFGRTRRSVSPSRKCPA